MYLMLGDIGFGLLTSPMGWESKYSASYAEQAVIEGKPLLQYTGDQLTTHRLTFAFRSEFCDPMAVWEALLLRLSAHQPLALYSGDGVAYGRYVLEHIDRTLMQSAADGTILAIEASLEVREYVDPQPLVTQKAQQRAAAPARKQQGEAAKVATEKKDLPIDDIKPVACHPQTYPAQQLEVSTVASHATRQPPAEPVDNDPWPILTP